MEFVTFEDYNDHLRECIEKGSGFVFITQEMVDMWKSVGLLALPFFHFSQRHFYFVLQKTTPRKEKRREASKENGCEHLEECVDEVVRITLILSFTSVIHFFHFSPKQVHRVDLNEQQR